jgi:hypothetical protein
MVALLVLGHRQFFPPLWSSLLMRGVFSLVYNRFLTTLHLIGKTSNFSSNN